MAFRIRRGTDTERLSIAPAEGELLYTTDTGNIYVGDGSTTGGNLVTTSLLDETSPELGANLDLGGNNIVGTGNINITGTITATGDINLGDGAEDNVIVGGQIQSSLIPSVDNTYDLGSVSSAWRKAYFTDFTGDFVDSEDNLLIDGDTGDATLGNIVGDSFTGSVFNDDSSIAIDAVNGNIQTTDILTTNNELFVTSSNPGSTFFNVNSQGERSSIRLLESDDIDLKISGRAHGSILFERNDINGPAATGVIAGLDDALLFTSDSTGQFSDQSKFFKFTEAGNFGIGYHTTFPNHTLDVKGEIVAESYVQFGSFTASERNNLTAENGMVIYNTSDERFQGYQNNSWINLDDGSPA